MPIFPALGDRAVVAAIAALATTGSGAKIQLYNADVTPNPSTLLASLPPCTFSGYALSAAVVWGTAYQAPDGIQKVTGVAKQFTQTAITVTDTAYGYVVVGTPSGTPFALASYRFANPIPFTAIGNGVVVLPELSLVQNGNGIIYSNLGISKNLAGLVAGSGYLDGAVVRLYANDITPNPTTLLGGFTELVATGYAESAALVWGVPFTGVDGVTKVEAASVQFTQTGTVATGTAYGWYMVGDPGGSEYLIASERFLTPVPFTFIGAGVVVDPSFWLAQ